MRVCRFRRVAAIVVVMLLSLAIFSRYHSPLSVLRGRLFSSRARRLAFNGTAEVSPENSFSTVEGGKLCTGENEMRESIKQGQGVASATGDFVSHSHATPSASPSEGDSVCLATFATVNRLWWLPWLVQSWAGPVSVAVYAPGGQLVALEFVLKFLRKCYPEINERVGFHVLYPVNNKPKLTDEYVDMSELDCNDPEESINSIMYSLSIYKKTIVKLPQNHLRNLARRSCLTDFSIVVDIDMIPSPFMYEKIDPLLREGMKCIKCALIIPVYEIETAQTHLPATKSSLLKFLDDHRAQRYHIQVYDKNQGNSKLDQWEASTNSNDTLDWSLLDGISTNQSKAVLEYLKDYKEIPYREFLKIKTYEEFWEPIMVLPKTAPGYDERFVGFGFCRSSLTYELHMRGYSFSLLDEAFLSHWGFQTTSSYPRHRVQENKENFVRYEAFKRELEARFQMTPKPDDKNTKKTKTMPVRSFFFRGNTLKRVLFSKKYKTKS